MHALIGVANLRDQRLAQPRLFREGDSHIVPSVKRSNHYIRRETDRSQGVTVNPKEMKHPIA